MKKERTFEISRSRTGLPVIDESGGGMTNTGSAQIVAGENGERLKPLYIPRGYANDTHVLFVARRGMHILKASHGRWGYSVDIYRITRVPGKDADDADKVAAVLVCGEENGDGDIPPKFSDAAQAAIDKSHDYHCRQAWYVK